MADEEFILEIDSRNKNILLASELQRLVSLASENDSQAVTKAYSSAWQGYKNADKWKHTPGWISAPDRAHSESNPDIAKAAKYHKKKHTNMEGPDKLNAISGREYNHEYSGSNYDPEAPYGLWAKFALNGIKIYIHSFCYKSNCLNRRDDIYIKIQDFLFDMCKGKKASLNFSTLPLGLVSTLLTKMGLYLGNARHEDIQLNDILDQ